MLKKDVEYVDFNDQKQNKVFYFHLSKTRMTDNMQELKTQLDECHAILAGDKRELTIPEVQKILDLIKRMVELSYGERSEDGQRFRQTKEVWEDFRYSAAYDKMLTDFMEKPETSMEFITALIPADLVEQAQANIEARPQISGAPDESSSLVFKPQPVQTAPEPEPKPYEALTREELEAVLARVKEQGGQ